jgi:phosphatidate cytidylyltransferase
MLRADPEQGLALVLAFFAVVWATDIGAYLVGRSVGGPKLAPAISPNKTWSGAIGGFVCGIIAGYAVARAMDVSYGPVELVAMGALISVVSQIGDLIESWWKRHFGVKDSGSLIPGHGGILDRIDGVLLASPVAMASHWVAQGGGLPWK